MYALGVLLWEMCAQQRIFAGLMLPHIHLLITKRQRAPRMPGGLPPEIQVHSTPPIRWLFRQACVLSH